MYRMCLWGKQYNSRGEQKGTGIRNELVSDCYSRGIETGKWLTKNLPIVSI